MPAALGRFKANYALNLKHSREEMQMLRHTIYHQGVF